MDFEGLGLSARHLQSLPGAWSPWFDVCHFILCCVSVRQEVGLHFSRSNPFATWIASLTACFAGSMVANPLLGKPIIAAISDERMLFLATVIWWATFYSPGDVFYKVVKNQVVYVPICLLKEIYRGKKVFGGFNDAKKLYPDHEVICIAIAVIKGNGSGFIKPVTRLVCGSWKPGSTELLKMSVTTKECIAAALLFTMEAHGMIPVSTDILYLCVLGTFIFVKLTALLADPIDPFLLANPAIDVLTGKLWDEDQLRARTKDE